MKYALSMVAVAGIAAAANAATTSVVWEVSDNGGTTWGSSVTVAPGSTVKIRMRVSLTGNTGAGSIGGSGGLAGFNFLPSLSNWGGGDVAGTMDAEAFPTGSAGNPIPSGSFTTVNHSVLGPVQVYSGANPITPRNGPGVLAAGNGRQQPFGANGTNTNGIATSSVVSGALQWKAGVIGNTGVSVSQLNGGNSNIIVNTGIDDAGTPGDESDDSIVQGSIGSFANNGRANVVAFIYSITLGPDTTLRTLVQNNTFLNVPQWFTAASGSSGTAAGATTSASINVTPTPGALALLGLGGLVAGRRRR